MMYTICTIYAWWWCHALTYSAQYSRVRFHRLGELMKQVVNCTFYIMCLRILDSLGNNLSVSFSSYLSQCTVNAENSAKCQASFESLAGWWSFIINRSLFTYISWLGYGVAVSLFTRLVRPWSLWFDKMRHAFAGVATLRVAVFLRIPHRLFRLVTPCFYGYEFFKIGNFDLKKHTFWTVYKTAVMSSHEKPHHTFQKVFIYKLQNMYTLKCQFVINLL